MLEICDTAGVIDGHHEVLEDIAAEYAVDRLVGPAEHVGPHAG